MNISFLSFSAIVLFGMASLCRAERMPSPYPAPVSGERLTPPKKKAPSINGAKVFGVRPGSPVLFYIPVSGEKPVSLSVDGLPEGMRFLRDKGVISGTAKEKGEYVVTVKAWNRHGNDVGALTIKVGDEICLTPPMGWNSWYSFSESVNQEGMLRVARQMADSGLIDHGWTYINIDDCWQGTRGGSLNALQGNKKFPDMKRLCDEIHDMGLKAGIYSTPWISTYAGFLGGSALNEEFDVSELALPENDPARRQETQFFGTWPSLCKLKVDRIGPVWMFDKDAKQWAEWGFDYVKVDWKPNDIPTTERIYDALGKSGRDIVLSLSNAAPIKNAAGLSVFANAWRTTGDIRDTWRSVYDIGFSQEPWQKFTKPGHWNDPDMLQVGMIGHAGQLNTTFRRTTLTPDEQYTQVSLWCLLSAPLLISCDLGALDDFTEGLLTNDEVLAVDQDEAARPAKKAWHKGDFQVWIKPLADRSFAVGFFNTGGKNTFEVALADLGLKGAYAVRDLWRNRNVGKSGRSVVVELNEHGVALLKFSPVH